MRGGRRPATRLPARPGGLGGLGRLLHAASPCGGGPRPQRRGRGASGRVGHGPPGRGCIVFGVLALTAVGGPLGLTAAAGASTPVSGTPGATVTAPCPAAVVASTVATYAVQPGDTLWHIVDDHLGDGVDGRCSPRWTWAATWAAACASWTRTSSAPAGGSAYRRMRESPPRIRHASPRRRTPHAGKRRDTCRSCLLWVWARSPAPRLARRAGRRRGMGAPFTEELGVGPLPSQGAQDAATFLDRFAGVPALHSFEAANCLLGRSLQGRDAGPRVRAICVSPSGVTFCLADEEPGPPPDGFVPVRDDPAGQVGHAALDVDDLSLPYLPVVLPIGDDADGDLADPARAGRRAAPPRRGSPGAVESRTGGRRLLGLVRHDPHLRGPRGSGHPVRARGRAGTGPTCPLLRRPRSLPEGGAPRGAVVTMAPVAASDLTVLVDRRGATLHPMVRVRPAPPPGDADSPPHR